jgi:hypothetical protein
LESITLKDKLSKLESTIKDMAFEDMNKKWQAVLKEPRFIKLQDLKGFLLNELGLPLPNILFPNNQNHIPEDTQFGKLRHSQKARLRCREIAISLWNQKPHLTIAAMINHQKLIKPTTKPDGTLYTDKTVRDWIKDLCPNRSPGRPKKK